MKMPAWVIDNPGPAEYRLLHKTELNIPEPGPGELRVRVAACGVCHTDLHEVEGDIPLPRSPVVPGHEIIGRVDKLGEGVSAPAIGSRAGIPWLASTCGKCRYCTRGDENLCENISFTGLHVDGGYASYTVVRSGFCYPIPERFSDPEAAPLMCAGVIGFRALRLALHLSPSQPRPRTRLRLGLYGFGASAHICLQVARHWGLEVMVFTRSVNHQQHARDLGAAWVGTADDAPPRALDSAIIFAPAGELVHGALGHLDRGGTLALAGVHMSPIPQLDYSLIYHERSIRSVTNSTRQDVIDWLHLAAEIPIRTTVQTFPLAAAPDALLAVKYSDTRGAAVLICGETNQAPQPDRSRRT